MLFSSRAEIDKAPGRADTIETIRDIVPIQSAPIFPSQ